MTLWYIPLEPLEERYTAQWQSIIEAELKKQNIHFVAIPGEPLSSVTQGDQFLSWASRVHYASSQMQSIARLFHAERVKAGDKFFFSDFWHHGMEGVRYMAQLLDIPVTIYAYHHAGVFDPTDLVAKLKSWGGYLEASWYLSCDKVFVGSEYHRKLILDGLYRLGVYRIPDHVVATGGIFDDQNIRNIEAESTLFVPNNPIVIWPHRLSPEKNVDDFYALADALSVKYRNVIWLITSSRKGQVFTPAHKSVKFISCPKGDYYHILSTATLMVSTAYQETFGLTIREAKALDTPIICPTRACYPEMILSKENLYASLDELIEKVDNHLSQQVRIPVPTLKQTGGFKAMLLEMGYGSPL